MKTINNIEELANTNIKITIIGETLNIKDLDFNILGSKLILLRNSVEYLLLKNKDFYNGLSDERKEDVDEYAKYDNDTKDAFVEIAEQTKEIKIGFGKYAGKTLFEFLEIVVKSYKIRGMKTEEESYMSWLNGQM